MIEKLNIKIKYNLESLIAFLKSQDLNYDNDIDLALVIKDNDKIIACACKKDNIFKMIAVSCHYQNQNLVNKLISELIEYSYQENLYHYFIFTKMIYENQFNSLGFNLLVSYEEIGLFEKGEPNFDDYFENIKINRNLKTGSIVMNCNPFTLGHYYLVKNALLQVDQLIVFVVEEDKSYFKFEDRIKLVKEGLSEFKNVIIVPSGPYIISQATFPTYFLKEFNDYAKYYTNIDIRLFMKIMDKLNIEKRFVGEEPYDKLTNYYNEQLRDNLEDKLVVIERVKFDNHYISASRVRKLLSDENYKDIENYVPRNVYEFLLKNYRVKGNLND